MSPSLPSGPRIGRGEPPLRTRIATALIAGLVLVLPAAAGGFEVVETDDGPVWMFPKGAASEELPEKHVTTIVNENGEVQTIKAPDMATLNAWREQTTAPMG